MKESELEKILVDEVRKAGGRAYKWISPGNDGVPDRIVFFPDGSVYFIELKTETGKLSAQQKIQIKRLKDLGQRAIVIRGLQELSCFLAITGHLTDGFRMRTNKNEVHPT